MLFSKRSHEGYLMVDHRAGGGIDASLARQSGALPVGGGAMLESATITCSHCQTVVVLNPDRTRSRGYCPGCDHYVCDTCEALRVSTGVCRPFKQIMDEVQERALRTTI